MDTYTVTVLVSECVVLFLMNIAELFPKTNFL